MNNDIYHYHVWIGFWFPVSYKIYLWLNDTGIFWTMASCSPSKK